jgi:hypothetical protein
MEVDESAEKDNSNSEVATQGDQEEEQDHEPDLMANGEERNAGDVLKDKKIGESRLNKASRDEKMEVSSDVAASSNAETTAKVKDEKDEGAKTVSTGANGILNKNQKPGLLIQVPVMTAGICDNDKTRKIWERRYSLPKASGSPHLLIHPSREAKSGTFDCNQHSLNTLRYI